LENGKISIETPWLNGERNGLEKKYDESGKLKIEYTFKNDTLNGVSKEYYENGNLSSGKNENCGKEDGIS
jgi:antitoxin component YwqK of YwqJK toxin-antitoxin module